MDEEKSDWGVVIGLSVESFARVEGLLPDGTFKAIAGGRAFLMRSPFPEVCTGTLWRWAMRDAGRSTWNPACFDALVRILELGADGIDKRMKDERARPGREPRPNPVP